MFIGCVAGEIEGLVWQASVAGATLGRFIRDAAQTPFRP